MALPRVDPDSVATIDFTSGTPPPSPRVSFTPTAPICCEVRMHMAAMHFPDTAQSQRRTDRACIGHAGGVVPATAEEHVHPPHGRLGRQARARCSCDGGRPQHRFKGTQYFLSSLFTYPDTRPADLERIGIVAFGGGAVAASFAEKMRGAGQLRGQRCYCSTEHPPPSPCPAWRIRRASGHYTDGRVLPGCEIRIVDEDGREVPAGQGRGNCCRADPTCAPAYIDPAMNAQYFTQEGLVPARGRRGGAAGCRGLCHHHRSRQGHHYPQRRENRRRGWSRMRCCAWAALLECAVFPLPDERTGERTHAVLPGMRPQPPERRRPPLAEIRAHLDKAGALAKQKWPESLQVVEDFPRTPHGQDQEVRAARPDCARS